MATAISPNSHQHTKGCTSATCCSPSRLWKTIQSLISSDNKEEFRKLCQDSDRGPHVLNVLLTCRNANDASLYPASHKHRVIQHDPSIRRQALLHFGKSVGDLNALQLALFHRKEALAIQLLLYLRSHAQPSKLTLFVNHVWGDKNTSLHLACFLGMPRLVRLLLELGADPNAKNARQVTPADCSNKECLTILQKYSPEDQTLPAGSTVQKKTPVKTTTKTTTAKGRLSVPPTPMETEPDFHRPSMLLQKANEISDPMATLPFPIMTMPTPSALTGDYFAMPDAKKKMHFSLPAALSPVEEEEDDDDDSEDDNYANRLLSSSLHEDEEIEKPSTPDLVWSPPPSPTLRLSCYHASPAQPRSILVDRSQLTTANIRRQRQVHFEPEVALTDACHRGDLEEIAQLTRQKKPPDIQCVGIQKRSALHLALMRGHDKVVKYLVDIGVDTDQKDADGWTPLHYAAVLGRWWAFEYLLSHNAKLSLLTNDGYKVQDCPETEADRRRCRLIIDRVLHRRN
ncbi:hypothetical protein EC973_003579 [Apophysomyces ossiformis]|uniref:Ankyrin repeat protein n=1 Tax=Apophysomyces ossiformis TaxID=679940 RepID=A0A8H7EUZ3_9FUNG|nr:hypothetical protein EC973_003579 [Apophysomyces ossiformis]